MAADIPMPKKLTKTRNRRPVERLVRRSKKSKLFSQLDMMRWARFLVGGRYSEAALLGSFTSWHDGPNFERYTQWH